MNKENYFKKEINYIRDVKIQEDLIRLLNLIPNYFFTIPASSTGKYHPEFAKGNGGLLRHTKVAIKIAYDLLSLEMNKENFSEKEKDIIIYAIMLHDSLKHGNIYEEHSKFNHPVLAAEFVIINSKLEEKELIANMIKSHMGEWNTSKYENTILPKPKTECEKFVHMCDYLASRKYLSIKFNGNEIEEEINTYA